MSTSLVVGGGAAGLSAALVLCRARRQVVVVDSGTPRNAPARHMHGFLSRDGVAPGLLLSTGRDEVRSYGGLVVDSEVAGIMPTAGHRFHAVLADGRRVSARRLLVATGLRDELPDVPGLRERWARDVLHCPYCHGHEVLDQRLGVLGATVDAVRYAQIVRQWSHDIVYFAAAGSLSDDARAQLIARDMTVIEGSVEQLIVHDDRLHGVALTDGRIVARDALFVPPRFVPHSALLVSLGCEVDADGWPVRDATGHTSVPGVWVAGNVANPRAQVITAAGEGSAAAMAMNAHLVEEDVRDAVHTFNGSTSPERRPVPPRCAYSLEEKP